MRHVKGCEGGRCAYQFVFTRVGGGCSRPGRTSSLRVIKRYISHRLFCIKPAVLAFMETTVKDHKSGFQNLEREI